MKKIIKLFTQEVAIVILLGAISVITAWAGVQSSLLGGKSNDALSIYMEGISKSNNLFLTAELKYRTDMIVWADKQTTLSGIIRAIYTRFALPIREPRKSTIRLYFLHGRVIPASRGSDGPSDTLSKGTRGLKCAK